MWKDKLVSYDGKAITYDAIGNPLTFDGYTFSWQKGRQLASIDGNGVSLDFKYNSDGLRTKKISTDKTIEYYYSGSILIAQYDGTNWLKFCYSADGEIVGFSYNNTPYYFVKNLQGDVIGIMNSASELVCTYKYDAWGNCTVYDSSGAVNTSSTFIGNVNPIRYRGYYYDTETELYYLTSRYYNPEFGRFINADGYVSTGEQIVAKNMYAYCLNNPVNYADPSGTKTVDVDMAEGIGYIFDIFEFAIQTTLGAFGFSCSTAVRPSNIGAGMYNKQVAQIVGKVTSHSLKASKIFNFLGWLTLALDLSMIVAEHAQSDQTNEGILWDISVDGAFTVGNFFISAKLGGLVGTAFCPGVGTAVGAAIGVVATVGVSVVLDSFSEELRGKMKSWVN